MQMLVDINEEFLAEFIKGKPLHRCSHVFAMLGLDCFQVDRLMQWPIGTARKQGYTPTHVTGLNVIPVRYGNTKTYALVENGPRLPADAVLPEHVVPRRRIKDDDGLTGMIIE